MNKKETKIKSYEGSGDYTYITYNSDDEKMAHPHLVRFKNLGFDIFYNEGLENPKSEIEDLRKPIENSKLFIPLLTQNIINSNLTCNEIFTASVFRIPIISIYLEEVQLSDGLEYAIGKNPHITQYSLSDDEFEIKLLDEIHLLKSEAKRKKDEKPNPVYQLFRGREQESIHLEKRNKASPNAFESNIILRIFKGITSIFSIGKHSKDEKRDDKPHYTSYPKKDTVYLGRSGPIYDYFHLSYSHGDIAEIFEDLAMFDKLGINTKYDAEISTGNGTTSEIISSIEKSRGMIFYLSERSLKSGWTIEELIYAFENHVPILFICLEDKLTEDPTVSSIMRNNPVILRYKLNKEEYISEIGKHIIF